MDKSDFFPSLDVRFSNFNDKLMHYPLVIVVYPQLGIQPKEDNLTVEQAWNELAGRLSYLFSIEVCNSTGVKWGDAILFFFFFCGS